MMKTGLFVKRWKLEGSKEWDASNEAFVT